MNCTLLKYGKHSVLGRVMLLCVKFEVELPAVGLLSLSVVSKIVLKNVQDFWQKVAAAEFDALVTNKQNAFGAVWQQFWEDSPIYVIPHCHSSLVSPVSSKSVHISGVIAEKPFRDRQK